MVQIPARKRRRSSEYIDVVAPSLVALNSMPGVWASQNRVIRMPITSSTGRETWINAGLGEGSADIIFSVVCECAMTEIEIPDPHVYWCPWADDDRVFGHCVARIGWIETKTTKTRTKTKTYAARDEHQRGWANAMRRKGHFVAHGIVTVEEAILAVERCRRGESQ